MNYRRFKKIILSIVLMCVFAIPMAVTATPPVYAQDSGVYNDVAQWRRGYRGRFYHPRWGRPVYRRGWVWGRPYHHRGWGWGRPVYRRGWMYRPYYRSPRFRFGYY
jgi:hypothetical protein